MRVLFTDSDTKKIVQADGLCIECADCVFGDTEYLPITKVGMCDDGVSLTIVVPEDLQRKMDRCKNRIAAAESLRRASQG